MPFTEVAHRVWVAHYDFIDINIGLVGGERGLLVVDTWASTALGRRLVDDVRALGAGEVVGVVNTHEHFDHTFGNGAFREAYGAIPIQEQHPGPPTSLGHLQGHQSLEGLDGGVG